MNIRSYYWVDVTRDNQLKVRSQVVRETKRSLEENGLTMPDELREMIFPKGVPVIVQDAGATATEAVPPPPPDPDAAEGGEAQAEEVRCVEDDLAPESDTIRGQASRSSLPVGDLLVSADHDPAAMFETPAAAAR